MYFQSLFYKQKIEQKNVGTIKAFYKPSLMCYHFNKYLLKTKISIMSTFPPSPPFTNDRICMFLLRIWFFCSFFSYFFPIFDFKHFFNRSKTNEEIKNKKKINKVDETNKSWEKNILGSSSEKKNEFEWTKGQWCVYDRKGRKKKNREIWKIKKAAFFYCSFASYSPSFFFFLNLPFYNSVIFSHFAPCFSLPVSIRKERRNFHSEITFYLRCSYNQCI